MPRISSEERSSRRDRRHRCDVRKLMNEHQSQRPSRDEGEADLRDREPARHPGDREKAGRGEHPAVHDQEAITATEASRWRRHSPHVRTEGVSGSGSRDERQPLRDHHDAGHLHSTVPPGEPGPAGGTSGSRRRWAPSTSAGRECSPMPGPMPWWWDCAHGHNLRVVDAVEADPGQLDIDVIAGNIATRQGGRGPRRPRGRPEGRDRPGPPSARPDRGGVGVPRSPAVAEVAEVARAHEVRSSPTRYPVLGGHRKGPGRGGGQRS